MYQDPNYIDINFNFNYYENSICIDNGDPTILDPDNTRSDIGANYFIQNTIGDCNDDAEINISDIILIINNCIIDINTELNCNCGDLDNDDYVNVIDIILLVNIILTS